MTSTQMEDDVRIISEKTKTNVHNGHATWEVLVEDEDDKQEEAEIREDTRSTEWKVHREHKEDDGRNKKPKMEGERWYCGSGSGRTRFLGRYRKNKGY